jgi:hypothetical protein
MSFAQQRKQVTITIGKQGYILVAGFMVKKRLG